MLIWACVRLGCMQLDRSWRWGRNGWGRLDVCWEEIKDEERRGRQRYWGEGGEKYRREVRGCRCSGGALIWQLCHHHFRSPSPLLPCTHTHKHTPLLFSHSWWGDHWHDERKDMIRSVLSVCAGRGWNGDKREEVGGWRFGVIKDSDWFNKAQRRAIDRIS